MKWVCRLALLLLAAPAWGATRYVKTPCTFNGDGTANSCAASGGAVGAWNSVANAASAASCGSGGVPTTLNITTGTYNENNVTFAQSCTATNELIVQGNGWTSVGAGSQDVVYLQNTRALSTTPGVDWTRCSTCDGADNAACLNVPATCTDAWYHTPSAGKKALWGVTPSGGITPRRTALTGLTAQYDAFSVDAADTKLTVKWGASLPSAPDVNGENNQFLWQITGDYIIVRGLNFRYNINSAINGTTTSDHVTIQDNTFKYFNDSGNGSSRSLYTDGVTGPWEVLDNEFAYSASEPLHITTVTNGTNATHIARNWVHGIGDLTILGAGTAGTPNCTTFTSDAPCCSYSTVGDFTGTIVENNLFDGCGNSTNSGGRKAILFESHANNIIVRSNLISNSGACFKWSPDNGGTSNHTN
jgi:hypothetical protein